MCQQHNAGVEKTPNLSHDLPDDHAQIRALVRAWLEATKAGDSEAVLKLMTDDAIFLVPGCAPMDKTVFAAMSRVPVGGGAPKFEGRSEIQEVEVSGDLAFIRTHLDISVTPPGALVPIERTGHTLSVCRRVNGRWLLARDANLLTLKSR